MGTKWLLTVLLVILMAFFIDSYPMYGKGLGRLVVKRSISSQALMNRWAGALRPASFMDVRDEDILENILEEFKNESQGPQE
ncbi:unnamed protein product [Bursaphelenchus xylophilus]|uniref:(pine wood nematode) hypothetical protein n=1 Tax=Bursaphelenchus xylophilus TaxID=6326 RepID=A0A1I7S6D0_BURXY|nr:unnamed protein product [Bursaphelenchus xylophilus]CAG9128125.1 unnamed protein product [Bursaphelenchus xylophilus]